MEAVAAAAAGVGGNTETPTADEFSPGEDLVNYDSIVPYNSHRYNHSDSIT